MATVVNIILFIFILYFVNTLFYVSITLFQFHSLQARNAILTILRKGASERSGLPLFFAFGVIVQKPHERIRAGARLSFVLNQFT